MQAPPIAAKVPAMEMAAYHQIGVFPSTIEQTASVTQSGPRLLSTCGGRAIMLRSGALWGSFTASALVMVADMLD